MPIRLLRWLRCVAGLSLSVAAAGANCNGPPLPTQAGPAQTGVNTAGSPQPFTPSAGTTPAVGNTVLEQLSLERINRARLRPVSEAAGFGISLNEGILFGQISSAPKQPVTMNTQLRQAAQQHGQDMLARNYFDHNSPEGVTPFDRMNNFGYFFATAGENLAWRGTTGALDELDTVERQHVDLFVDEGIDGRGHRRTMLNGDFREVGISILRGNFTQNGTRFDSIMQTQDYATTPNSPTFVLGVVYNDGNRNGQYDFGEGVSGSVVSLAGVSRSTNTGGGFSFAVAEPGTYTLTFNGNRSQVLSINQGDSNVKIDLIDGNRIVVNLGLGELD